MTWDQVFLTVWAIGILVTWPPLLWVSYRSRITRGEPIVPHAPLHALFCERRASGRAVGTIFGRASNCLQVSVADEELWITPVFPFNMIAPYGFMGLEWRVPKNSVEARAERGWLGNNVTLQVSGSSGRPHVIELRLKSPDAFITALRA